MQNIIIRDQFTQQAYALSPHRDIGCISGVILEQLALRITNRMFPVLFQLFGERVYSELLPAAMGAFTKFMASYQVANPTTKKVEGLQNCREAMVESGMSGLTSEQKLVLGYVVGMMVIPILWAARAEVAIEPNDQIFDLTALINAVKNLEVI